MTVDTVHRLLIAYDIADDHRRSRIAKVLESYGDRIQFSVFVVEIKPAKLVRLRAALRALVELSTDSVLVCDLGPLTHGGRARLGFIGLERTVTGQGPIVP